MPRQKTGRPVGRPLGSGQLGEEKTDHKRLTVRLPMPLYDALYTLAGKEHYTREEPDLARTVRAALEHYLICPYKRQTANIPIPSLDLKSADIKADSTDDIEKFRALGQAAIEAAKDVFKDTRIQTVPRLPVDDTLPATGEDETRQTINVPAIAENNNEQTEISIESPGDDKRQTEIVQKLENGQYVLGKLCEHGHEYHGTGQSVRQPGGKHECVECKNARSRAYKERQRTKAALGA